MILNVLDFEDVATALAQAADGDSVYFPGLSPYVAPPDGWRIARRITILGDGVGAPASAARTVIAPAEPEGPVFVAEEGGMGFQILGVRMCSSRAEPDASGSPAAEPPPDSEEPPC